jgi:hypothetical protein
MHRAHKNSFSSQKCPINSSPPRICTPLPKTGASRARDNHDHPEQHISEEPNPTIVDEWSAIRKQIQVGHTTGDYGVDDFLPGLLANYRMTTTIEPGALETCKPESVFQGCLTK